MNKSSKSHRIIVFAALCCAALTILGLFALRGVRSRQIPPRAVNAVSNIRALQIVSTATTQVGENVNLHVTVKNVSEKGIVEYAFIKRDGSMMSTSGATTGWILAPGSEDTIIVSLSPREGQETILFAALFEDGTGEGDAKELANMRDYRVGVAHQFGRALAILQQKKNASDNGQAAAVLDQLDKQFSELPEEEVSENVSPAMASGIKHAKQFVLQYKSSRQRLEVDNATALQAIREDSDRLLGEIEKALSKIHQRPSDSQRSPNRR